jgi:hypothetical protein
MARPRIDLDDMKFNGWEQLDALIIWSNQEYCAERLGINRDTLTEKIKEKTGLDFPAYKEQKKEAMRVNLRKKQYDIAMTGNVSMLIWLGKNELGQSDKQEFDLSSQMTIKIETEDKGL